MQMNAKNNFVNEFNQISTTDTPKEVQPPPSTVSSASSLSFHTPAIDQSPTIVPADR